MTNIDTPVNNCVLGRKFRKPPKRSLVAVVPLLLMLGACGDSDDASSSDTAASTSDGPQLTFTGSDCVYAGPEEVAAGVVTVEMVNDSDGIANVFVGLLDEGKTVQDVIDHFGSEPFTGAAPTFVSDMGGQSPAQAGETVRWESSLAAGDYFVTCVKSGRTRAGWLGGGLTVVDG